MLWRLEPFEVWLAQCVAWRRTTENKSNPHNYSGVAHLEPQDVAELAGACCEMAVASRINRYWGGLAWAHGEHSIYEPRVADVSDCVEVKRIRRPDNPIVFSSHDIDKNSWLFLCYPMFYKPKQVNSVWVDIIGYEQAQNLVPFIHETRQTRKGPTFVVHQKYLKKLPIEPKRPQAIFTKNL